MKVLKDILYGVGIEQVVGDTSVRVKSLVFDSRKVKKGVAFVAIKGTVVDGHQYIKKAIAAGAIVIVHKDPIEDYQLGITYVRVDIPKHALAVMAANYFNHPSRDLKLIGITGTNGKTTIATLLYQMLHENGVSVGLLSTVKIMIENQQFPATHTTPDPITINGYLRKMVDAGLEFCFMEVSSHGIDQCRTAALYFEAGIFTNLSHDHLDYHQDFATYRNVKKRFFDELPQTSIAITNADDKNGMFMLQNTKAKKNTYALKSIAD
ncbi:MAG: Mur ligase family protein, partial [Flavobacteriaceae bacterium]|nr:Mur ligase family protein [Flavobacteriaceae bacterium]